MARSPEWSAAYDALDSAVQELHRLIELDNPEPPAVATDYVLVVGAMYIQDGGRNGVVEIFPSHGMQPAYITTGLVESARQLLSRDRADG